MKSGCRLDLYSWAGTSCSGKNAYVDEFVEGESVNVASDKEDGTVVLLEHNTTIYMKDYMIDSLDNPILCEDNDMRFDLRP